MSLSISAFFPAYNDGGTIASMVLSAARALDSVTDDYEIIVVNDGSADYTADILEELSKRLDRLRVIHHERNRGYGGALRTGFAEARKDWVFYTDGDAQYDPRELVLLVKALRPGIDMVNGYKIGRSDPLHRIVIGAVYNQIVRFLFGLHLRDVDCDFRLINRQALQSVTLTSTSGTICLELVRRLQDNGGRFAEVPVHHFHRAYGKSQFFNFRRLWLTGVHLLELWWELRRAPGRPRPESESQVAKGGALE